MTRRSATSESLTPPSAATRTRMQRQRRRDTAPELALRRSLHARGWRYRVDIAPLKGLRRRSDVVFTRKRVAVYVDGCFWHRCPIHGTVPKSNTGWWIDKLDGNVRRDRDTDRVLEARGWRVVRIWEHEDVQDAVRAVESALHAGEKL